MLPPPGWETHHLVEQARTSDFGTQAIQNTANALNLPKAVHREVTSMYVSGPRSGTPQNDYKLAHPEGHISTVRDYVKTLPYEAQRRLSIKTVREAMDDVQVSAHDRTQIEHALEKLEIETLCLPDLAQTHRSTPNVANLRNAASVRPWDGTAQTGSFVDLGDGIVAQHIGRGAYTFMNVQQDLSGA